MKNTIKITASIAVLAGLLIAPSVLASELPKTGEVSNVFLSIFGISLLISGAMIWQDNKKK